MRLFALSLAIVASAQLVLSSTPAWAQGPGNTSSDVKDVPAVPPPPPAPPPPAAGEPAPPAVAPAPPPTATGADGLVEVHMDTKGADATLEHRAAPNAPWEAACTNACDKRLPVTDDYRVVGVGINESHVFHLDASKGDKVTLHVGLGQPKMETVGKAILITGAALIVAGVLVMAIGSKPSETFQADGVTDNKNFDILTIGTSLCLGGVVAGIAGGATWYNNHSSHVGGDVMAPPPARGSLPSTETTGMRTPMPGATVISIPILSRSF